MATNIEQKHLDIIEEHIQYHAAMLETLVRMRDTGELATNYPKKPRSSLKTLNNTEVKLEPEDDSDFDAECEGSDLELGQSLTRECRKLHSYLVSKEVQSSAEQGEWAAYCGNDLEMMATNLKDGRLFVEAPAKKTLQDYLDFGHALQHAFDLFQMQYEAGNIHTTWRSWVENSIGLKDAYARRLRQMYRELSPYPRTRNLAISLTEMTKLKSKFLHVLKTNPTISAYWKNV
jgi:hypothetical protein